MTQSLRTMLVKLPRVWKSRLLVCFDFVALTLALWASFALRLDYWALPSTIDEALLILAGPAVAIPTFLQMGLYRAVVRYLPERALWTMVNAVSMAVLLWVVGAFLSLLMTTAVLPRSVPIIYWALASLILVGSRFAAKHILWPSGKASMSLPAIAIYGAGQAGTQLALSLRSTYFVVGFLDDNPGLHSSDVAGVRVYSPSSLPALIRNYGVKQVILSMPSLSAARRKEIVTELSAQGVKVSSIPAMADLVTGDYKITQVREIEIDDLLGRSPVPPDQDLIRQMIVGRTIMVTGAGGSIGSELCRKIAQWRPQRLILFEANEFALYNIERELGATEETSVEAILGSVADSQCVRRALKEHGVEAVFHAAAHKHVPLVEANAIEGIKNNVFGTKTIVEASFELGVRDFVLISTDKAVRPTNVMGATKRWAELIVQQHANLATLRKTGQRFSAVRFGNVLGSNGSVVPLFKEQIARGGPVTLTDPGMTRYFMSIREAAELIVQAGSLSTGGDVFLLDMGQPILISDLAENMVKLAGLKVRSPENPEGDIEILTTGKRPGEKMYEELFYDETTATQTTHPKILRAINSTIPELQIDIDLLHRAVDVADEVTARHVLFDMVARSDSLRKDRVA